MTRMFRTAVALFACVALAGCAGADADTADEHASPTGAHESHADHHHHHDYSDVPVVVTLEPDCLVPGTEMTVSVETAPRTGVLYLAYFSDGKSGAKEPLGAGYGGNGGGYADDDGIFEESWTLSEEAPHGPARLRVLTLADDGEEIVDFTVAGPDTTSC